VTSSHTTHWVMMVLTLVCLLSFFESVRDSNRHRAVLYTLLTLVFGGLALLIPGCGGAHQAHELVDAGPDSGAIERVGHVGQAPAHRADAGPVTLAARHRTPHPHTEPLPDDDAGGASTAPQPDASVDPIRERDAGAIDAGQDAGRDAGHDAGHNTGTGGTPCQPAFSCQ
jgi:hypothetical protein